MVRNLITTQATALAWVMLVLMLVTLHTTTLIQTQILNLKKYILDLVLAT